MTVTRKISFPDVDVRNDIQQSLIDELHQIFVPAFAVKIIQELDALGVIFKSYDWYDIYRGITPIDKNAMMTYSAQWDDTKISCPYSYCVIAPITQRSIDAIVQKCEAAVIIEDIVS